MDEPTLSRADRNPADAPAPAPAPALAPAPAPITAPFTVPIAVFDLDDTLVRGDAGRSFVHRLLRSPWRLAAAALSLPVTGPLLLAPRTFRAAANFFSWLSTVGRSDRRLNRLAAEFARHHAGPASGHPIAPALDRLREHLAAGDRVIVATGSSDLVARAICQQLGLTDVELVASVTRRRLGGLITARHCLGPGKLAMLAEAPGVTFPLAHAYSDSALDLPLLLAADSRYAIDPSPTHLAEITRDTDGNFTHLHWRTQ